MGAPDVTERVDGHPHRLWRDAAGSAVIEEYAISGLGHGVPLATSGDEACGVPGPYMIEAGISATYRIAASWELAPVVASVRRPSSKGIPEPAPVRREPVTSDPFDPARLIDDALHAAGLIKRRR